MSRFNGRPNFYVEQGQRRLSEHEWGRMGKRDWNAAGFFQGIQDGDSIVVDEKERESFFRVLNEILGN